MLSEKAIKEFQALYKTEYGQDISMEKTAELGERLIRFYKAVYKPSNKTYGEQVSNNKGDGSDSQRSR